MLLSCELYRCEKCIGTNVFREVIQRFESDKHITVYRGDPIGLYYSQIPTNCKTGLILSQRDRIFLLIYLRKFM